MSISCKLYIGSCMPLHCNISNQPCLGMTSSPSTVQCVHMFNPIESNKLLLHHHHHHSQSAGYKQFKTEHFQSTCWIWPRNCSPIESPKLIPFRHHQWLMPTFVCTRLLDKLAKCFVPARYVEDWMRTIQPLNISSILLVVVAFLFFSWSS